MDVPGISYGNSGVPGDELKPKDARVQLLEKAAPDNPVIQAFLKGQITFDPVTSTFSGGQFSAGDKERAAAAIKDVFFYETRTVETSWGGMIKDGMVLLDSVKLPKIFREAPVICLAANLGLKGEALKNDRITPELCSAILSGPSIVLTGDERKSLERVALLLKEGKVVSSGYHLLENGTASLTDADRKAVAVVQKVLLRLIGQLAVSIDVMASPKKNMMQFMKLHLLRSGDVARMRSMKAWSFDETTAFSSEFLNDCLNDPQLSSFLKDLSVDDLLASIPYLRSSFSEEQLNGSCLEVLREVVNKKLKGGIAVGVGEDPLLTVVKLALYRFYEKKLSRSSERDQIRIYLLSLSKSESLTSSILTNAETGADAPLSAGELKLLAAMVLAVPDFILEQQDMTLEDREWLAEKSKSGFEEGDEARVVQIFMCLYGTKGAYTEASGKKKKFHEYLIAQRQTEGISVFDPQYQEIRRSLGIPESEWDGFALIALYQEMTMLEAPKLSYLPKTITDEKQITVRTPIIYKNMPKGYLTARQLCALEKGSLPNISSSGSNFFSSYFTENLGKMEGSLDPIRDIFNGIKRRWDTTSSSYEKLLARDSSEMAAQMWSVLTGGDKKEKVTRKLGDVTYVVTIDADTGEYAIYRGEKTKYPVMVKDASRLRTDTDFTDEEIAILTEMINELDEGILLKTIKVVTLWNLREFILAEQEKQFSMGESWANHIGKYLAMNMSWLFMEYLTTRIALIAGKMSKVAIVGNTVTVYDEASGEKLVIRMRPVIDQIVNKIQALFGKESELVAWMKEHGYDAERLDERVKVKKYDRTGLDLRRYVGFGAKEFRDTLDKTIDELHDSVVPAIDKMLKDGEKYVHGATMFDHAVPLYYDRRLNTTDLEKSEKVDSKLKYRFKVLWNNKWVVPGRMLARFAFNWAVLQEMIIDMFNYHSKNFSTLWSIPERPKWFSEQLYLDPLFRSTEHQFIKGADGHMQSELSDDPVRSEIVDGVLRGIDGHAANGKFGISYNETLGAFELTVKDGRRIVIAGVEFCDVDHPSFVLRNPRQGGGLPSILLVLPLPKDGESSSQYAQRINKKGALCDSVFNELFAFSVERLLPVLPDRALSEADRKRLDILQKRYYELTGGKDLKDFKELTAEERAKATSAFSEVEWKKLLEITRGIKIETMSMEVFTEAIIHSEIDEAFEKSPSRDMAFFKKLMGLFPGSVVPRIDKNGITIRSGNKELFIRAGDPPVITGKGLTDKDIKDLRSLFSDSFLNKLLQKDVYGWLFNAQQELLSGTISLDKNKLPMVTFNMAEMLSQYYYHKIYLPRYAGIAGNEYELMKLSDADLDNMYKKYSGELSESYKAYTENPNEKNSAAWEHVSSMHLAIVREISWRQSLKSPAFKDRFNPKFPEKYIKRIEERLEKDKKLSFNDAVESYRGTFTRDDVRAMVRNKNRDLSAAEVEKQVDVLLKEWKDLLSAERSKVVSSDEEIRYAFREDLDRDKVAAADKQKKYTLELVDLWGQCTRDDWILTGKRIYKEQVIGALIEADGAILAMGCGEGKTITNILAEMFISDLRPDVTVMLITSHAHLAKEQSEESQKLAKKLGKSVEYFDNKETDTAKKAFPGDKGKRVHIVYSTFDSYMYQRIQDRISAVLGRKGVMPPPSQLFVLADEIDHLLVQRALTPYLLSYGERTKGKEVAAMFTLSIYDIAQRFAENNKDLASLNEEAASRAENETAEKLNRLFEVLLTRPNSITTDCLPDEVLNNKAVMEKFFTVSSDGKVLTFKMAPKEIQNEIYTMDLSDTARKALFEAAGIAQIDLSLYYEHFQTDVRCAEFKHKGDKFRIVYNGKDYRYEVYLGKIRGWVDLAKTDLVRPGANGEQLSDPSALRDNDLAALIRENMQNMPRLDKAKFLELCAAQVRCTWQAMRMEENKDFGYDKDKHSVYLIDQSTDRVSKDSKFSSPYLEYSGITGLQGALEARMFLNAMGNRKDFNKYISQSSSSSDMLMVLQAFQELPLKAGSSGTAIAVADRFMLMDMLAIGTPKHNKKRKIDQDKTRIYYDEASKNKAVAAEVIEHFKPSNPDHLNQLGLYAESSPSADKLALAITKAFLEEAGFTVLSMPADEKGEWKFSKSTFKNGEVQTVPDAKIHTFTVDGKPIAKRIVILDQRKFENREIFDLLAKAGTENTIVIFTNAGGRGTDWMTAYQELGDKMNRLMAQPGMTFERALRELKAKFEKEITELEAKAKKEYGSSKLATEYAEYSKLCIGADIIDNYLKDPRLKTAEGAKELEAFFSIKRVFDLIITEFSPEGFSVQQQIENRIDRNSVGGTIKRFTSLESLFYTKHSSMLEKLQGTGEGEIAVDSSLYRTVEDYITQLQHMYNREGVEKASGDPNVLEAKRAEDVFVEFTRKLADPAHTEEEIDRIREKIVRELIMPQIDHEKGIGENSAKFLSIFLGLSDDQIAELRRESKGSYEHDRMEKRLLSEAQKAYLAQSGRMVTGPGMEKVPFIIDLSQKTTAEKIKKLIEEYVNLYQGVNKGTEASEAYLREKSGKLSQQILFLYANIYTEIMRSPAKYMASVRVEVPHGYRIEVRFNEPNEKEPGKIIKAKNKVEAKPKNESTTKRYYYVRPDGTVQYAFDTLGELEQRLLADREVQLGSGRSGKANRSTNELKVPDAERPVFKDEKIAFSTDAEAKLKKEIARSKAEGREMRATVFTDGAGGVRDVHIVRPEQDLVLRGVDEAAFDRYASVYKQIYLGLLNGVVQIERDGRPVDVKDVTVADIFNYALQEKLISDMPQFVEQKQGERRASDIYLLSPEGLVHKAPVRTYAYDVFCRTFSRDNSWEWRDLHSHTTDTIREADVRLDARTVEDGALVVVLDAENKLEVRSVSNPERVSMVRPKAAVKEGTPVGIITFDVDTMSSYIGSEKELKTLEKMKEGRVSYRSKQTITYTPDSELFNTMFSNIKKTADWGTAMQERGVDINAFTEQYNKILNEYKVLNPGLSDTELTKKWLASCPEDMSIAGVTVQDIRELVALYEEGERCWDRMIDDCIKQSGLKDDPTYRSLVNDRLRQLFTDKWDTLKRDIADPARTRPLFDSVPLLEFAPEDRAELLKMRKNKTYILTYQDRAFPVLVPKAIVEKHLTKISKMSHTERLRITGSGYYRELRADIEKEVNASVDAMLADPATPDEVKALILKDRKGFSKDLCLQLENQVLVEGISVDVYQQILEPALLKTKESVAKEFKNIDESDLSASEKEKKKDKVLRDAQRRLEYVRANVDRTLTDMVIQQGYKGFQQDMQNNTEILKKKYADIDLTSEKMDRLNVLTGNAKKLAGGDVRTIAGKFSGSAFSGAVLGLVKGCYSKALGEASWADVIADAGMEVQGFLSFEFKSLAAMRAGVPMKYAGHMVMGYDILSGIRNARGQETAALFEGSVNTAGFLGGMYLAEKVIGEKWLNGIISNYQGANRLRMAGTLSNIKSNIVLLIGMIAGQAAVTLAAETDTGKKLDQWAVDNNYQWKVAQGAEIATDMFTYGAIYKMVGAGYLADIAVEQFIKMVGVESVGLAGGGAKKILQGIILTCGVVYSAYNAKDSRCELQNIDLTMMENGYSVFLDWEDRHAETTDIFSVSLKNFKSNLGTVLMYNIFRELYAQGFLTDKDILATFNNDQVILQAIKESIGCPDPRKGYEQWLGLVSGLNDIHSSHFKGFAEKMQVLAKSGVKAFKDRIDTSSERMILDEEIPWDVQVQMADWWAEYQSEVIGRRDLQKVHQKMNTEQIALLKEQVASQKKKVASMEITNVWKTLKAASPNMSEEELKIRVNMFRKYKYPGCDLNSPVTVEQAKGYLMFCLDCMIEPPPVAFYRAQLPSEHTQHDAGNTSEGGFSFTKFVPDKEKQAFLDHIKEKKGVVLSKQKTLSTVPFGRGMARLLLSKKYAVKILQSTEVLPELYDMELPLRSDPGQLFTTRDQKRLTELLMKKEYTEAELKELKKLYKKYADTDIEAVVERTVHEPEWKKYTKAAIDGVYGSIHQGAIWLQDVAPFTSSVCNAIDELGDRKGKRDASYLAEQKEKNQRFFHVWMYRTAQQRIRILERQKKLKMKMTGEVDPQDIPKFVVEVKLPGAPVHDKKEGISITVYENYMLPADVYQVTISVNGTVIGTRLLPRGEDPKKFAEKMLAATQRMVHIARLDITTGGNSLHAQSGRIEEDTAIFYGDDEVMEFSGLEEEMIGVSKKVLAENFFNRLKQACIDAEKSPLAVLRRNTDLLGLDIADATAMADGKYRFVLDLGNGKRSEPYIWYNGSVYQYTKSGAVTQDLLMIRQKNNYVPVKKYWDAHKAKVVQVLFVSEKAPGGEGEYTFALAQNMFIPGNPEPQGVLMIAHNGEYFRMTGDGFVLAKISEEEFRSGTVVDGYGKALSKDIATYRKEKIYRAYTSSAAKIADLLIEKGVYGVSTRRVAVDRRTGDYVVQVEIKHTLYTYMYDAKNNTLVQKDDYDFKKADIIDGIYKDNISMLIGKKRVKLGADHDLLRRSAYRSLGLPDNYAFGEDRYLIKNTAKVVNKTFKFTKDMMYWMAAPDIDENGEIDDTLLVDKRKYWQLLFREKAVQMLLDGKASIVKKKCRDNSYVYEFVCTDTSFSITSGEVDHEFEFKGPAAMRALKKEAEAYFTWLAQTQDSKIQEFVPASDWKAIQNTFTSEKGMSKDAVKNYLSWVMIVVHANSGIQLK